MSRGPLDFTGPYSAAASTFYDRVIAPATDAVARPHVDRAVAALPPGGAVLDVGCGGGQTVAGIARMRPDLRVVGAEPSGSLLRRAARRAGDSGVTLVRAPAEDLGLPHDSFDLTFSLFAVKHWGDREAGLAECVRVTRPSGTLLVAELDAEADLSRWRAFVARTAMPGVLQPAYAAVTHRPFLTRATGRDQLAATLGRTAGLTDVTVDRLPDLAVVVARAIVVEQSGSPGGPRVR